MMNHSSLKIEGLYKVSQSDYDINHILLYPSSSQIVKNLIYIMNSINHSDKMRLAYQVQIVLFKKKRIWQAFNTLIVRISIHLIQFMFIAKPQYNKITNKISQSCSKKQLPRMQILIIGFCVNLIIFKTQTESSLYQFQLIVA
ncbi:unnamed protein product [Paramecium sonneborni]|uniref:Transmembrane protein n=1 Tax=Paramecium sonneborni TaxID=65129 RepID=A0A8S1PTX6_9CILI|nr:unnamed protein product [Paramecium sonneborni]